MRFLKFLQAPKCYGECPCVEGNETCNSDYEYDEVCGTDGKFYPSPSVAECVKVVCRNSTFQKNLFFCYFIK